MCMFLRIWKEWLKMEKQTSVDKDVEQLELLYSAGKSVNW